VSFVSQSRSPEEDIDDAEFYEVKDV